MLAAGTEGNGENGENAGAVELAALRQVVPAFNGRNENSESLHRPLPSPDAALGDGVVAARPLPP
jgi:hypothetical protein